MSEPAMQSLASYVAALSTAVVDVQRSFDEIADQSELSDRLAVQSFSFRFGYLVGTTRQVGFEIGVWPLNVNFTKTHEIRHTEASWISLEFVRVPAAAE